MTTKTKIELIERIEEILEEYQTNENRRVLHALQQINGREKGIIDFWAWECSGNYNYTIEDVYNDLKDLDYED